MICNQIGHITLYDVKCDCGNEIADCLKVPFMMPWFSGKLTIDFTKKEFTDIVCDQCKELKKTVGKDED